MDTYIHTYIHTHIHTYTHTCMHAYIHTCIHTHMFVSIGNYGSNYMNGIVFCNQSDTSSVLPLLELITYTRDISRLGTNVNRGK